MRSSVLTCIGHREQPVILIPVNKQIQNRPSAVADDHSPKKRRPTFPKERFYMWVSVGEDDPVDRTGENCDDDYHEDERCVQEVDVKV